MFPFSQGIVYQPVPIYKVASVLSKYTMVSLLCDMRMSLSHESPYNCFNTVQYAMGREGGWTNRELMDIFPSQNMNECFPIFPSENMWCFSQPHDERNDGTSKPCLLFLVLWYLGFPNSGFTLMETTFPLYVGGYTEIQKVLVHFEPLDNVNKRKKKLKTNERKIKTNVTMPWVETMASDAHVIV